MNKLVAGLALSTSVFAASAYYFHGELAAARERHAAQSMASTKTPPGVLALGPAAETPTAAVPTSLTTASPNQVSPSSAAGATPTPSTDEAARKVQAAVWAPDFLKRYGDAAARANLRALELARLANSLVGLDRRIKLDAEGWAKLREMMVDYELEKRAVSARCTVDPACAQPGPAEMEALNARRQAIRDFLGDENYQAMEQFRSLEQERSAVANLQNRLPANLALSAKQSEALAAAIHEERTRKCAKLCRAAMRSARSAWSGISVVYPKDAATPEQSLESAQLYLQRVRDRVASMLNAGQLAAFNQMQDDTMISFRRFQRQQLARQTAPDKQP